MTSRSRELAELASAYDSGGSIGFRNRIINGDMRIDQRNAGATLTSAGDGSWPVDRWICYHNIATVNIGQNLNSVTPPAGFTNYLGMQITASATAGSGQYTNFQHYVEGFNVADLGWGTANAQSITLSFWVRSSLTGVQGFGVQNVNSDYGYPFTVTINSANTWEYKTVTIPGPTAGTWNTTNGRGVTLITDLGMGSSFRFATGSWQSGNVQGVTGANSLNQTLNATFYITGVQLEAGPVATPFERRPYGTELALCQRYFISMSGGGSNPAVAGGLQINTTTTTVVVPLPTTMRSVPTIGADGTLATTDGFSYNTGATLTAAIANNNSAQLTVSTASVGQQGRPALLVLNTSSSSKLNLTAEL